ncbi:MAG: hypothetical protein ACR2GP_08625 [Burkholderiaceae bacterium]
MLQLSKWVRFTVAGMYCGIVIASAQAATNVRSIQSAGTAQLRSATPGQEGIQTPEFAPTFANVPGLQDGPNAAAAPDAATQAARALKEARKRMVNRSIAKSRGIGESIAGDARERASARLLGSFDGLDFRDQRLANGGNQFSLEPPDQALCVGNGFVLESVNDVIRVFDRSGNPLSGVVDLNTFYGYSGAINRSTGRYGPSITDPTCYYDPQVNRFFHVVLTLDTNPATRGLPGCHHLDLAVHSSGAPRGSWPIYRIPGQDDGTQGTPVHADCPCLGDYPHIGADAHGIYLTTNEFPFAGGFNGAQIYALSKRDLVRGAVNVTLVQIDTSDHLLDGNPGFTVWPAVSPRGDFETANRGTEYFLSSLAVFTDSGNENRLRVWALGNTRSLESNNPDVTLVDNTVRVRSYGVPPPSDQKPGPTPLAECINDRSIVTPFGVGCWRFLFGGNTPPPHATTPELIDSNDSRMQQVFYTGGRLYGALDTVVRVGGGDQAGIAYYAIRPFAQRGSVIGIVENQGKIGVAGNNVNYPAIAALPDGRGLIAFTLVGADHFPSAAYVHLGPNGHEGSIKIAADGKGPEDGFTGYAAFGSTVARWGDYGAAALDGDDIWIASEYIGQTCTLTTYIGPPFGSCGGTRASLGTWDTRISRVRP